MPTTKYGTMYAVINHVHQQWLTVSTRMAHIDDPRHLPALERDFELAAERLIRLLKQARDYLRDEQAEEGPDIEYWKLQVFLLEGAVITRICLEGRDDDDC